MAASAGNTTIKEAIRALTVKEIILVLVGAVLLTLGIWSGSAILIIAVLLISVGLWGYAYFSLVSRMTPSGIHHQTMRQSEKRESFQPSDSWDDMQMDRDVKSEAAPRDAYNEDDRTSVIPETEMPKPEVKIKGTRLTEAHLTQFFDLDSEIFPSSSEPRSEFEFLLGRVLAAIKESLIAHTVAFFWTNFDKKQLVFQGRASDSHNLITERKIPLENDVVSQIALKGKPEFISHINPSSERDVLPYYNDFDFVKSFIGVPVYYQGRDAERTVVGVLAIDSKAEDAFGQETLALLRQFTKLLAALIKSHTEKYDLLVDSELVTSIRRMHDSIRENLDLRTIVSALVEQTKRLIGYDYLAVTMFNDDKRAWVIYHVDIPHEGTYISPHQIIKTDNSLVSTVLERNKHILVDDLSTIEIPRFNEEEKIDSQGSILIAPISSFKKCYGTVSLERRDRSGYSGRDIEVLYRLVENVASALEILYMSELVDKYVIIDEVTGLLRKNYFEQRMKEEIRRADDFGSDLTYLLFSIDNMQQLIDRFGKEGFDTAIFAFSNFLRNAVRHYDIIGRLDYNKFGIILLNTPANEGYLWAEKIRKNFSSQVLTMIDKKTSITISSGVCGLTESMQFGELTQHVTAALQKAVEGGGNIVRVY
jgi:diguanylate cyclase (GGDEF)-like protein